METSTNGAGAAVEAAAAGREDQRGVAGLGFVAGGRAAPEGTPDPELVEQAKRRAFTAEYKARILAEADACEATNHHRCSVPTRSTPEPSPPVGCRSW